MPDLITINRRLTEWFIDNGPASIIELHPIIETRTPGKGASKAPGPSRGQQKFKKIWPGGDGFNQGQDGTHHKFDMIIVGLYDCDAEIGDQWQEGEQKYVIHSEFPNNLYERKFGVFSYGNQPSDG